MSTFIEVRPEVSADTQTTIVRIDDDLKISVRQVKSGTPTDIHLDFSGMDVGDELLTYPEPVEYVRVTKLGADNRATIAVKCYHLAGQANTVPAAGVYWFDPSKSYNPEGADPGDGRTAAPNPTFSGTTQAFPVLIFAPDPISPALGANTATAQVVPSRYTQLGTLARRREIVKNRLRNIVFNNSMMMWMVGAGEARHQEAFSHWLEHLVRAASIDANFDTEAKFNLLEGDSWLDPYELAYRIENDGITTGTAPPLSGVTRSAWTQYVRLGAVASSSPFAYTAPTTATWTGSTTDVAGLTLSGVPTRLSENNGRGWLEWLRETE